MIKEQNTDFLPEFAQAVAGNYGKTATDHKSLAGCNFGETTPDCMNIGLGPDEFDCSGLVIDGISNVIGMSIDRWPDQLRHVRQMAGTQYTYEGLGEVTIGKCLVLGRNYTINGESRLVPAHIGVVTERHNEGVVVLHAQASKGRVVRSLLDAGNPHRLGSIIAVMNPTELVEKSVSMNRTASSLTLLIESGTT